MEASSPTPSRMFGFFINPPLCLNTTQHQYGTLLLSQRACKAFQDVIVGSPKLRQKLFFTPPAGNSARDPAGMVSA
ncbi:hypothetical protein AC579_1335 [Pseudocercospora musae]|uniref:Uncharacterized protein n=1 Tax=Pseudocercospora musae TaxID=113226 RepID=A0A139IPH8_9PEZI|nr:hypothetical protein AC579_1335 [Pseudocercospora musae]